MPILAFDTATGGCSLAILDSDQVLTTRHAVMARGQAEVLIPWIGEALAEIGLSPAGLTAISTTTGPGAFTGIRIGLAAARGLALALNIPGIGISCFDVFAAMSARWQDDQKGTRNATGQTSPTLIVIESKRLELYLEARIDGVNHQAALSPANAATWLAGLSATPAAWHMIGDGVERLATELPPGLITHMTQALPDPVVLGSLAQSSLADLSDPAEAASIYPLTPLYIRDADANPAGAARVWLAGSDA